jgi:hypothetical protein
MKEISKSIEEWTACCNEVWRNWFIHREEAIHDFAEIEEKLLQVLVIRKIEPQAENAVEKFVQRLRVEYKEQIADVRQFCVRQAAGNIFGTPKFLTIQQGSIHKVQSIDTMGTMLEIGPYVEIVWENGFILEPVKNVRFYLST